MTRGREGVKNDEKSSDVICECPLGQMIRMMARKKLQENINVPLVIKVILSHTTSRNIDKENMDSKF